MNNTHIYDKMKPYHHHCNPWKFFDTNVHKSNEWITSREFSMRTTTGRNRSINEFSTMTSNIILHIIAIVMKVPQRLSAAYPNDQYINMLFMGGIEYILKRDFFDYYCHDLKQ
jgi:hypothetical protein